MKRDGGEMVCNLRKESCTHGGAGRPILRKTNHFFFAERIILCVFLENIKILFQIDFELRGLLLGSSTRKKDLGSLR